MTSSYSLHHIIPFGTLTTLLLSSQFKFDVVAGVALDLQSSAPHHKGDPDRRLITDSNIWPESNSKENPEKTLTPCTTRDVNPSTPHDELGWEWTDTMNDPQSCGGCIFQVPSNPGISRPQGVDCTDIAGVADVSCISGTCEVHACLPGWRRRTFGSACVQIEGLPGRTQLNIGRTSYRPEHRPL